MTNKITRNELETDCIVMERWFDDVKSLSGTENTVRFEAGDQYGDDVLPMCRELVTEPMTRDEAVAYAERSCRLMNTLVGEPVMAWPWMRMEFYLSEDNKQRAVDIMFGDASKTGDENRSFRIRRVQHRNETKPIPPVPVVGTAVAYVIDGHSKIRLGVSTGRSTEDGTRCVVNPTIAHHVDVLRRAVWLDLTTGNSHPDFPTKSLPEHIYTLCSDACRAKLGQ